MILTFVFSIFYYFLNFILSLLPTVAPLPTDFIDFFSTVIGYLYNFDSLLPVATILQVLTLAVFFHGGILLWRFINYIIHLVRG